MTRERFEEQLDQLVRLALLTGLPEAVVLDAVDARLEQWRAELEG